MYLSSYTSPKSVLCRQDFIPSLLTYLLLVCSYNFRQSTQFYFHGKSIGEEPKLGHFQHPEMKAEVPFQQQLGYSRTPPLPRIYCVKLQDDSWLTNPIYRSQWPRMKCLRPLQHCNHGFESHSTHGLSVFLPCLCCRVQLAALRHGWSPVQGVLPTVYKIHSSGLILTGNGPEVLIRKVEE
jgi:hypothetical protein